MMLMSLAPMSENCSVLGMGGGRKGERIDIGLQLAELLFRRHAKLLFFVDDQQSEVFPFHRLADELVGADKNVDLACRQVLRHLSRLFGRACTRQVVHAHRHALQSFGERLEMLKGQYGGRHQHGYLLVVASGFEGGAYSHLRLAKSHVATDQAVHRTRAFHVVLHLLRRFQLVGCVLVEERGLQLVLHIIVGREGEATLVTALGIELDEVARYVLDALLRLFLEFVPSARAEDGEAWRFPDSARRYLLIL